MPASSGCERVDVAADGRVVDAEEEAEEGVGDVGAVVDQEHQEPVGQHEGVLAAAAGLALAARAALAAGVGLLVERGELREQTRRRRRG